MTFLKASKAVQIIIHKSKKTCLNLSLGMRKHESSLVLKYGLVLDIVIQSLLNFTPKNLSRGGVKKCS